MAAEEIRIRRLDPAAIAGVMSREAANFRTYWKGTAFSSILEPIVYLLAFGVGLGATLIDGVDGLSYAEFVATGMVATAVIFSSALPAMYGTFVKERFQNTYDAILAAPVDTEELVTAEMLWIGLRAGFFGCFPLLVGIGFGLSPTWGMLLVPAFAFVTALGWAAFGIAVAASVAKIDQLNYVTTLVITPCSWLPAPSSRSTSSPTRCRCWPTSTPSTSSSSSCAAPPSASSPWTCSASARCWGSRCCCGGSPSAA